MTDISVTIGTLHLNNPVLVASGTFGYGDDVHEYVDVNALGGIVTKSLSLKPRDGNPPVRIVETASGMLNSIGLANIGVHRFIAEKLPRLSELSTTIIANIAASSVDEYCEVLSLLEPHASIRGYEINISCPNVKEGGLSFGTDVHRTAEITRRLRALTRKTLLMKLTPNVTSVAEFAKAVEAEGADGISLINTLVGMAVDVRTRKPKLSTTTGGLSGPAIKPIALAKVYEAVRAVSIPVIGIGGITSAEDALEFLIVGARAVQVGTANFIDPAIGVNIAEGIRSYCEREQVSSIDSLIGSVTIDPAASVLRSWM